MQYPLISEYVRAIQDASDNLGELAHLVPVLDDHSEPYRSSGAFAVVFKMKDEQTGKCYALKCFLEEQEGRAEAYRMIADELDCVDSSYVTSVKYLEKEIFVDSSCEEDEFPVLLMDWVDGETMETYVAANYQDEYAMAMLCYRFCKMAAWLRSQPFAHGDIKPDNIMVRPDGTLTLVDYDGMFVPAMKGQKSPTIGTKDFSHPLRTIDDFDETIDDFALASIALSLKAISLKPSLLDEYGAADRLLFSADDYRDLSKSKIVSALQELMNDGELKTLYSLFLLASAKKNLAMCSFRLFAGKKPENKFEILSTEVTEEDLKNAVTDEYGVKYSRDGKRLLKAPDSLCGTYKIKPNTKVICCRAFGLCKSLSSIVIPNSVTSIGYDAFSGCTFLSNLVIPEGVTSIGNFAFSMCESLLKIVIPNSVTKMYGNPFVNWNGKLKIHSSMFVYDNGVLFDKEKKTIIAFRRNDMSYIMPNSVISIGDSAFENCSTLSDIVVSNRVTSIGRCAFSGCESLSNILIPNSVTSIGKRAFLGCSFLSSLVIPNSVTSIGDWAFGHCDSLSSIVIPNSVTSIGDSAFYGCDSLSSVVVPNSVTSIGDSAFFGCDSLSSVVVPNSVTSIGDSAFCGCHSLSSIVIPNSVTSIGRSAFSGCKSLSSIVIPNSVTSIGGGAFVGCDSLLSIVIPDSVTKMDGNPFGGWNGKLTILSSKYKYDNGVLIDDVDKVIIAFRRNDASYIIPNSVTSIGDSAFSGCESLSSIVIPNSVTSIGNGAFLGCDSLSSIVIPDGVTSIGKFAFMYCQSLSSVVIPNSVTSIGDSAFSGCHSLSSIVIPDSVTSIGNRAFDGCKSLSSIVIPNSVTSIGEYAFWGCHSLSSIVIPNSVTSIGEYAFWGCHSLSSIVIPNSVTSIGEHAFWGCVSLPPSIKDDIIVRFGKKVFIYGVY